MAECPEAWTTSEPAIGSDPIRSPPNGGIDSNEGRLRAPLGALARLHNVSSTTSDNETRDRIIADCRICRRRRQRQRFAHCLV